MKKKGFFLSLANSKNYTKYDSRIGGEFYVVVAYTACYYYSGKFDKNIKSKLGIKLFRLCIFKY